MLNVKLLYLPVWHLRNSIFVYLSCLKSYVLFIMCFIFSVWQYFISLQKLSLTAPKQSQVMVWKVHKSIVWEHVLDEMYHAAYNLVKRLDHEWEENKEVRIVGAFSLQNSYWYILSVAQYQILFGTQMTSSVCFITFLKSRISCHFCSCTKSTMAHIFSCSVLARSLVR